MMCSIYTFLIWKATNIAIGAGWIYGTLQIVDNKNKRQEAIIKMEGSFIAFLLSTLRVNLHYFTYLYATLHLRLFDNNPFVMGLKPNSWLFALRVCLFCYHQRDTLRAWYPTLIHLKSVIRVGCNLHHRSSCTDVTTNLHALW